jgi:hypothetical protein
LSANGQKNVYCRGCAYAWQASSATRKAASSARTLVLLGQRDGRRRASRPPDPAGHRQFQREIERVDAECEPEHVVDFDFSAGDAYWQSTGAFWRGVRAAWEAVYAERDSFEYLEVVDGEEMFAPLFEHAERLEGGEPYDAAAAAEVIRATFARHLR